MNESLYETGIRPIIDDHLLQKAQERRDYGDYWSASSAGYCMRKVIFDRLQVPYVKTDPRKQRVFTSGDIFHKWIQELTKEAGISVEQEIELIDNNLKVKGHIDDLIQLVKTKKDYILYDYKTQNSRAFSYSKFGMNPFHRMQLGTYLYMINTNTKYKVKTGRILKISKDDLRLAEEELVYEQALIDDVKFYWETINELWDKKEIPPCQCADLGDGFMADERYNDYYYNGKPCSIEWYKLWKENKKGTK